MKKILLLFTILLLPAWLFAQQSCRQDSIVFIKKQPNIDNTLQLDVPIKGIYTDRDGRLVLVTENPDGSLTETPLRVDGELNRTLIQDPEGNEYVVTSDGQVMGVDEFQATGGNSRLMDNYNEEKEAQAQPSVTFSASPSQQYGFDAYTEIKTNIQNEYPELTQGYRPAFKSVASYAVDRVQTNGAEQGITFRNEMGLPPVSNGNELTVRGGAGGSDVALYAYSKEDSTETIVGKLNILSFDRQVKKVYIISVNNATLPDAVTLQHELNRIYAPAVVNWDVSVGKKVTVTFPAGQMRHGGSGAFSVYNPDQKSVLKAFGAMDKEALYLFFVEQVTGKEGDYAGYMPLQYQVGFIYDNPNVSIIAHELAHGAFTLYHTFSDKQYIASQGATSNLMDYTNGTELWKHQWQLISNPKNLWFKSWQDEEEGEIVLGTGEYIGFSPDGHVIKEKYKKVFFTSTSGYITGFETENGKYQWDDNEKLYELGEEKLKGWQEDPVTGKVAVWRGSLHPECYTLYQFISVQNYTINDFEFIKQQINELDNAKWVADYVEGKSPACEELFKSEVKSILKGQEVMSYLNENGFATYTDLINEVGLLVSKNDAEKYDDFVKFAAENKSLRYQNEETLRQYYTSLESYYKAHTSASLTTNSNCPTCPQYPIDGDAYWDSDGRNWLVKDGKWVDLSGEFDSNPVWKEGIDVQKVHQWFYQYKLTLHESGVKFGYSDRDLFEKTLWRTTQYLTVRTLKEQWAVEQVGDGIWIPIYGSLREAYFLNQVAENDMMLQSQAAFNAVIGASDVFLIKAAAVGLFRLTAWAGTKIAGQDIYYLAKKQLLTARLSFILSTETPVEAATFLSKQGDNIIEIVSKEHSRFIKYDLETGQTLICRYSDDVSKATDLVYEDFRTISVNTAGASEDDIVRAVVNGVSGVKFTAQQIDDYVKLATKNPDSKKVMMGKYTDDVTSYTKRAGTDHTYFDLGEEWNKIKTTVNGNDDEMWRINRQFIENAKKDGKEFFFSHDPRLEMTNSSLKQEYNLLIQLGAKKELKQVENNLWQVIW
jgi:hypothetical protein